MTENILEARDVRKSFGGVKALKGVSMSIRKGEIHCLAGENGCGKSTLIKIVSGFYEPDAGEITINGTTYDRITTAQAIREGVQVIYQDLSVFPNLTVMENLAINHQLMAGGTLVNWSGIRRTAEAAAALTGLSVDMTELVENLSLADKQLIAISRALLSNAKLIIMDEPTTALAKKEVSRLFGIIKRLQAAGISILFVSHKLDEVFEISERFTIFRSGENVVTGDTGGLDDRKFAYYMTGREFAEERFAAGAVPGEPVLETRALTLENGFYDVSLTLRKGEILGITGLLGSGRSELAKALVGYVPADSGQILLNGLPVRIASVVDAVRHGVACVPEDRLTEGLFLIQSILDNIAVSRWDALSNRFGVIRRREVEREAAAWIRSLSVATRDPLLPVQTLSGGNQQKVVLARWLANDLKALILNGPTVGVDIGAKYDIHRIIRGLAGRGLAVLVISDDLPEVMSLCNRVLVMRSGRLAGELAVKDSTTEELAELSMRE
ncbi:MAG: sugar ABC transporter ATP-binding protein [Planctomycetota bacterium]|jgi:simple sugar transport system ATP-binding protein|nr:sugar ABC transporter ATP-binding protein [Planctomycetota bacterium]